MYEEAIPAYTIVIRRLPEYAKAYHGRGIAYYHEERFEQALDDFDRAIELDPNYPVAYHNRAAVHLENGEVRKALADLRKALSLYDRVRDARAIAELLEFLEKLRDLSP